MTKAKEFSFEVNAKTFSEVIAKVGKAADVRSNILVLRNVLFGEFDGWGVQLTATDHRTWIRADMCADVKGKSFPLTVPLLSLEKALKHEGKNMVTVVATYDPDEPKLKVGRVTIKGISAEDFPSYPEEAGVISKFSIPAKSLRIAMRRALIVTDDNNPRAYMGGVYFSKDAFVATDGARLSIIKAEKHPVPKKFNSIVSTRTLVPLLNILDKEKDEGEVECIRFKAGTTAEAIKFKLGEFEVIGRLIEADYPNYKRALPSSSDVGWSATLNRKELVKTLKDAQPFMGREGHVDVGFNFKKKSVRVHTKDFEDVEFRDEVEAKFKGAITGHEKTKPLETMFRLTYLLDMLRLPDECKEITLQVWGWGKPMQMVVSYEGVAEETFLQMPINV